MSNAKYWCELCKCWLPDTVQARTNHENGSGHKIAMQRKLREMRLKADREKQEEEKNKKELQRIEQAAGQAYEKDVARLVRFHADLAACLAPQSARQGMPGLHSSSALCSAGTQPSALPLRPTLALDIA